MACRDAYLKAMNQNQVTEHQPSESRAETPSATGRLLFGVDSAMQANDLLQNNLRSFEWVTRNKLYPNFWGRNIAGENSLTREEVDFLHRQGCKIAAIYRSEEPMKTEEQGKLVAKQIDTIAFALGIPEKTAIFLEIDENATVSRDFMQGYAQGMLDVGYTPGFRANTDAKYSFDRESSRGVQTNRELFRKCLIWAVAPSLAEYDRVTTTHLIHPDHWKPYAPSGMTRGEIAIWQYGKQCHPIADDDGREVTFNVDLVKNENIIINYMF